MTSSQLHALASTDLKFDSVIRDALRAVRQHLNMPLSFLSIFEEDRVRIVYTSTDGDPPFIVEGALREAEGTYCKATRDGFIPQFLPETRADLYASRMPITQAGPIGAVVSIPIRFSSSQCLGMFCCLDHASRPDLSERDHAVVQAFASLVTAVLENRGADLEKEIEARTRIQDLIDRRAFSLVHQPIVTLHDRQTVMFEALCRFGGLNPVPPDQVFAEARGLGLGEELELCVFERTLAGSNALSAGHSLSMNLSPNTIVTDRLMDIVWAAPAAENLVIELTEHVDFGDYDVLADRLSELRSRGFRIAVDDFGNGHASLNAVLRLQPDIVKLDRALIARVEDESASQSLVQAVATFSQDIGAVLLAEGIEHETQIDPLRRLGVTLGQGYHFGRPQAPAQGLGKISAA